MDYYKLSFFFNYVFHSKFQILINKNHHIFIYPLNSLNLFSIILAKAWTKGRFFGAPRNIECTTHLQSRAFNLRSMAEKGAPIQSIANNTQK